jgi:hypothetical protein
VQLSRIMGHANVTTTLTIHTHLFDDDHADAMAALDAMATSKPKRTATLFRTRGHRRKSVALSKRKQRRGKLAVVESMTTSSPSA